MSTVTSKKDDTREYSFSAIGLSDEPQNYHRCNISKESPSPRTIAGYNSDDSVDRRAKLRCENLPGPLQVDTHSIQPPPGFHQSPMSS